MKQFIKERIEFICILISWVVAGVYIDDNVAVLLMSASILLLKYKGRYIELILGFMMILVLSDNRNWSMEWTGNAKNVYIVLLSLIAIFDRKHFTVPNKLFLPFVPFLIYAALIVYKNPEPIISFEKVLSYFLLFAFIPLYFSKLLKENPVQFLRDVIYFSVGLLLVGFLYAIVRPDLTFLVERYNGILGNPNGVGIFCNVLFFAIYIITDKYPELFTNREKLFFYVVIGISMIMAGTRTGIMSVMIFLLFARFNKLSPFYGFAILIVIALSYQLFTDNLSDILHSLGLEKSLRSETIESGSGRFVAWTFAWTHIQKNYFFGMGWDYDNQLFTLYRPLLSSLGHNGGIHNVFLGFWLCLGIVGVVLFYYAFFKTYFIAASRSRLALPFMYAVLFSTTFEAWLMGSLNPFTIYWLLALQVIFYESIAPAKEKSLVPVL